MPVLDRTAGHYSELEREPRERRSDRIWSALQRVLSAGWSGSREFRGRLESAGLSPADIRDWDDWARIPKFSKKELISFQQEHGVEAMLSGGIGALSRVYMSPGPIFDPEGRSRDYWGWTEAFFAAGFRPGDLAQMTFSYHLTPAGLMLEEPLREIGCAVIPAGPGNTAAQIELLTKLPVTGFVGMASYLKIIKDTAKAQGLADRLKLAVAFVAAERLPAALRDELEKELGMRVRQGYGTADVGCIAYECQELGGMHLSSRRHVEIVDPATGAPLPVGENGEVVVTPLTEDYPLIRLATGDLSRLIETPCACGRTALKLAGILGRVDDTAKVKGQFLYPHQIAELMTGFPMILRWQVLVQNPGGKDALTLRLALNRPPDSFDADRFVRAFQDKLKLKPALSIEAPEAFEENAAPLVDKRNFE
jgi:phenylacetate-CoA ligase